MQRCPSCGSLTLTDDCEWCGPITKTTLKTEEAKTESVLSNLLSRRFPMQNGPDIDWMTAEKIYIMYSYLYGNEQTLERIGQRGGFGWAEVELIQRNYLKKKRQRNESV